MYVRLLSVFWIALFCCGAFALPAQEADEPKSDPPTYLLRVENQTYGRVEVSVDGARYFLIGRVVLPATKTATDKTATAAGRVLRGSSSGVAFSVASGQALKLLPYPFASSSSATANARNAKRQAPEPSAIVTDLNVRRSLFNDMTPPPQTPVKLQFSERSLIPFPSNYVPTDQDVFVFEVRLPGSDDRTFVQKRMEALAKTYASGALERARAEQRTLVSGLLTLKAKLPPNEPDPIVYIVYAVDNDLVATQNTPPFSYSWDTRSVPDGEYVVEIRGLNKDGRLLTRVRTLVLVQNHAEAASSSAP